jgi:hypothetical protein
VVKLDDKPEDVIAEEQAAPPPAVKDQKSVKATVAKKVVSAKKAAPKPRPTLAEESDFVKILYYGKPKSGKTTAAATLARLGRVLYIDAESGLKKKPLLEHGIPVANIEPFREITVEALDEFFWTVRGRVADGGDHTPIGMVWDSTSESHKKLLEASAAKTHAKAVAKGTAHTRTSEYAIELQDYGTNTQEMRHLIRQFRDLEMHVGFVALEKREQDDDGKVTYGPDLTAKLAEDLAGFVDIVCHTFTLAQGDDEEPEYWGLFRASGKYTAGDRFKALPPRLINPSFDRVIAYVNGDLDVESDPEMAAAKARRSNGGAAGATGESPATPTAAPSATKAAGKRGPIRASSVTKP